VFKPQLVLMDEPLGALDKQLREHMQIELKALHRQLGVTFVYVTHDQGEALTMSDRVAVFDQGIIQQLDPVDALYESPQNAFVASFIGDSNRLTGQIGQRDGDRCTMTLAGGHVLSGMRIGEAAPGQTPRPASGPSACAGGRADTQAGRQCAARPGRRHHLFRRPRAPAVRLHRPGPVLRQGAAGYAGARTWRRASRSPWLSQPEHLRIFS
jgi:putative spermidine/putrescine transport system ATP-binding protein